MAAVLACGPAAVLSHRSAAALHGLRSAGSVRIEVTVPGRSGRERPGIQVHRSTTLAPADATRVRSIPCTTVSRTLLDLAEVIARRPLERAFDQAEIMELFDLRALNDQLARNATRSAACRVRALLDEHCVGSTPTWSELEERMLALCRSIDLPVPEVNAWLVLDDGGAPIQPDFLWRAERLVVETDGRSYHGTRQARERDTDRDQRLVVAGWRPVRVTWRQLAGNASQVGRRLLSLIGT